MKAEIETAVAPIVRSVLVACSRERAFRVFTEEIGTWWPLDQYSIGDDRAETVAIEPSVGGRILETVRGGEPAEWGSVLVWEPFDRLVIEWRVRSENPRPRSRSVSRPKATAPGSSSSTVGGSGWREGRRGPDGLRIRLAGLPLSLYAEKAAT